MQLSCSIFQVLSYLQNVKDGYGKREKITRQLPKHYNTIFKLNYINISKERTVQVIFQDNPNPNFTWILPQTGPQANAVSYFVSCFRILFHLRAG